MSSSLVTDEGSPVSVLTPLNPSLLISCNHQNILCHYIVIIIIITPSTLGISTEETDFHFH